MQSGARAVQVFLVPCSEEEYGHDPLALPRDPDMVTSMAMKEMDLKRRRRVHDED